MSKRIGQWSIGWWVVAALSACSSSPPKNETEYLAGATLWFQTSGEARALMHQAFRLGRVLLDADLKVKRKKSELPPAIIVDVDETVLDNSPFEARVVATGEGYPKGWDEWVQLAQAKPLPGSVEFLTYAKGKGVRIFYLTNRKDSQKAATSKNLKEAGFPDVTDETVVCRSTDSNKEPRRQQIRAGHRVVLLVGDNLNDFDKAFDQKTADARVAAVDTSKDKFGTEYLMIPNPMYGDWEGALYGFDFNQAAEKKFQLRRAALRPF